MAIHLIARDLYRAIRAVEDLEARLAEAPPEARAGLEAELRRRRGERDRLRRILAGHKAP